MTDTDRLDWLFKHCCYAEHNAGWRIYFDGGDPRAMIDAAAARTKPKPEPKPRRLPVQLVARL